jgi:hypothetical protein
LKRKVQIFGRKNYNLGQKRYTFMAEKEAILILEPKIQIFVSKSTHFGRKKNILGRRPI